MMGTMGFDLLLFVFYFLFFYSIFAEDRISDAIDSDLLRLSEEPAEEIERPDLYESGIPIPDDVEMDGTEYRSRDVGIVPTHTATLTPPPPPPSPLASSNTATTPIADEEELVFCDIFISGRIGHYDFLNDFYEFSGFLNEHPFYANSEESVFIYFLSEFDDWNIASELNSLTVFAYAPQNAKSIDKIEVNWIVWYDEREQWEHDRIMKASCAEEGEGEDGVTREGICDVEVVGRTDDAINGYYVFFGYFEDHPYYIQATEPSDSLYIYFLSIPSPSWNIGTDLGVKDEREEEEEEERDRRGTESCRSSSSSSPSSSPTSSPPPPPSPPSSSSSPSTTGVVFAYAQQDSETIDLVTEPWKVFDETDGVFYPDSRVTIECQDCAHFVYGVHVGKYIEEPSTTRDHVSCCEKCQNSNECSNWSFKIARLECRLFDENTVIRESSTWMRNDLPMVSPQSIQTPEGNFCGVTIDGRVGTHTFINGKYDHLGTEHDYPYYKHQVEFVYLYYLNSFKDWNLGRNLNDEIVYGYANQAAESAERITVDWLIYDADQQRFISDPRVYAECNDPDDSTPEHELAIEAPENHGYSRDLEGVRSSADG